MSTTAHRSRPPATAIPAETPPPARRSLRRIAVVSAAAVTLSALAITIGSTSASAANTGGAVLGPASVVNWNGGPVLQRTDEVVKTPSSSDGSSTTSTTTAPTSAASPGGALRFAPPALANPVTVRPTSGNSSLKLDPNVDYIIEMPSTPLESSGGLNISGGHNVVLIGGEIHHPRWWSSENNVNRGLYLKNQTGTVHVEGLRISGLLSEGINLSQTEGAIVQLQNIRIDQVQGSYSGNHADVIQTWAGPRQLLIDGLTGSTTYQGFFLLPSQFLPGVQPERFDFNRIDIDGTGDSGYMFWTDEGFPVSVNDVWTNPNPSKAGDRNQFLWPKGSDLWNAVRVGTPAVGDFVSVSDAGIGYRSPGYR
jgi:hypothetical protein